MTKATMIERDSTLATKCPEISQALTNQKRTFTFTLNLGSSFSFSLDTREKSTHAEVVKKKMSPFAVRRNTKRKEEFLKKKAETLKKVDVNFEKETPETPFKVTNLEKETFTKAVETFECDQCDRNFKT